MVDLSTLEIIQLEKLMEELANAPKEPLGKRQPGEKCAFEKPYPPQDLK